MSGITTNADLAALIANIPEDEPIFLLRASDPAAPTAVRSWAQAADRLGADRGTVNTALEFAQKMALVIHRPHHRSDEPFPAKKNSSASIARDWALPIP